MPSSGASWVAQFPTSNRIEDLEPAFRSKVTRFLDALTTSNARVQISATRRPAQRAYLMHYAWSIVHGGKAPEDVPAYKPQIGAMSPIDIDWVHRSPTGIADSVQSKLAAEEMVKAYALTHLRVAPALNSLHIRGEAIDMNISWSGSLSIKDAMGTLNVIPGPPHDGTNASLIKVGASYGVVHMINVQKDKPHWSINGH